MGGRLRGRCGPAAQARVQPTSPAASHTADPAGSQLRVARAAVTRRARAKRARASALDRRAERPNQHRDARIGDWFERLEHQLEVVRVADHLLRTDRQARWLIERQLRHAQVCDQCAANRRAWRRRPDGALISGTHETAIEVETTAKPLDQYLAILDAYADHGVASHWCAAPTVAQERILQAVAVRRD